MSYLKVQNEWVKIQYTVSTGIEAVSDSIKPAMALDGSNLTSLKVGITAYPNPSINSITFDVNGFEAASLKVEIYNTSGSTLFSQKDLSYEIHVADLPAGQYFYRISKDKEILGAGSWVKK